MTFSKSTFQRPTIQKTFEYTPKCLLGNKVLDLESNTTENGRFYKTPEGKSYASMTTILGATADKGFLDDWRNRIGHKNADLISHLASSRGSNMHEIAEKYIRGDSTYLNDSMPMGKKLFSQIRPFLDKNLEQVFGIEQALYCDPLRTAGRSDLIGIYNGLPSVIDYKSSTNSKQEDWIQDYFVQGAGYGILFHWMTKIKIQQIVILIGVENGQKCQEFIVPFFTYKDHFLSRVQQFYGSR